MRSSSSLVLLVFDKAVLAASATWVLAVLLGFVVSPAPLERVPETLASLVELKAYMGSPDAGPAVPGPAPALAEGLREELAPQAVPPADAMPAWMLHRRPQFLYTTEPALEPLEHRHLPSKVTDVDSSARGQVRVAWSAGGCSEWLLVSYRLWRRAGDGLWEPAGALSEGEAYVDRRVEPETTYAYRVTSRARLDPDDVRVQQRGLTDDDLPAAIRAVEGPPSVAVTTPRELALSVAAVVPGDPIAARPGQAQVTIYRWDPERERFARRSFLVREGEAIGAGAFATPWTLHRVGVDRRPMPGRPGFTQPVGWIEYGAGQTRRRANDREPFRPDGAAEK